MCLEAGWEGGGEGECFKTIETGPSQWLPNSTSSEKKKNVSLGTKGSGQHPQQIVGFLSNEPAHVASGI